MAISGQGFLLVGLKINLKIILSSNLIPYVLVSYQPQRVSSAKLHPHPVTCEIQFQPLGAV